VTHRNKTLNFCPVDFRHLRTKVHFVVQTKWWN
jgi:hypothetical protein